MLIGQYTCIKFFNSGIISLSLYWFCVILRDRLGSDILLVLRVKGQVLHHERAHLKVPGCSLVLSALLTQKLPTFLSHLNEISGGCEKILPVSGSFWSILKLLKMILLTA